MIRINLLPPEFRKGGGGGASADKLGVAAGVVVCLAVILFWAWIEFVRIPAAEVKIGKLQDDLKEAKKEANKVRDLEGKIGKIKGRVNYLEGLVRLKMNWAHTISDFADMLGRDRWSVGGFVVSAGNLSISPASGGGGGGRRGRGKKQESVRFNFRWEMELLGQDPALSGVYVEAFFTDVETTDFWVRNGFVGRPVEPYTGDKPNVLPDIDRVNVNHSLLWVRDQKQQAENRKILAEQAKQAAENGKGSNGDESERGDG